MEIFMETALKKAEYYDYADYLTWDDENRYELIDGIPVMMSSPSITHQSIIGALYVQIWQFLRGKRCMAVLAPFDVRLNADGLDDTVVQPDITVICDRAKLDEKRGSYKGAPEMAIEVLSPSSKRLDNLIKLKKYQDAGVNEYWIADPENKTIRAYTLKNGAYTVNVYHDGETAPVCTLDGLQINLADVFTE
jgi:Uma2 family endonuclease